MKNKLLTSFILAGLLILPLQAFAFTDITASDLQTQSINTLYNEKIITGYADGTFKPNNLINRAEFTKIVMAWSNTDKIGGSNCFQDVHNEWFSPYVCAAKSLSIIQGYDGNLFKPSADITLAEALKIVIEAKQIPLTETGISRVWYQKYLDYATQNPSLLQSINSDPLHDLTRGEMALLIYNLSQLTAPTTSTQTTSSSNETVAQYQPMSDAQISQFSAIINNNFPTDLVTSQNEQFLSTNLSNLLQNFILMRNFGLDTASVTSDQLTLIDQLALLPVFTVPSDTSKLHLLDAQISHQNAYLVYDIDSAPSYIADCISFINENGWKIDQGLNTGIVTEDQKTSTQANIENLCKNTTSSTALLTANDLVKVNQKYSSEYQYQIYLNGNLIGKGGGGGVLTNDGLPLVKGSNQLKIVTGSADPSDSGSIQGFQYTLSLNGKQLASAQNNQENNTVVTTFNY